MTIVPLHHINFLFFSLTLDCLASKLIGSLLEGAILLLKSKKQEVVKSSLIFVRV